MPLRRSGEPARDRPGMAARTTVPHGEASDESGVHLRPAPDGAVPALRLLESPGPPLPAEEAVDVAERALGRNDFAGAVAVLSEARPVLGLDAPDALRPRPARGVVVAPDAQGDLARARGRVDDAAERYRAAALALHDARF